MPVSASTLVSISRTMDYRHHATDVIAGAVIGIIVGWWGYRQYYPPLVASKSWQPYEPRIPRDAELPVHGLERASRDVHAPLASNTSHSGNSPIQPPYTGYPPQPHAEPRFADGAVSNTYRNGGIATAPDAYSGGGLAHVEDSLANNPAFPDAPHSTDHSQTKSVDL